MFRVIKQTLLSQGRIGRYLSYAAGEVILIVAGILLAVSINEWNEERLERKVVNGILSVIAEDMEQDRKEVDRIVKYYYQRRSTFIKVSYDSIAQSDIPGCDSCLDLIASRQLFSVNTRGLQQLNEYYNYTVGNRHQDSIIFNIVNFYTTLMAKVDNFNHLIDDDVVGNLTYWRDEYDWFTRLMQGTLGAEDTKYFGSQNYRNRVAFHYVLIYENYLPILEMFQKNSEKILKDLDERLRESSP
jgi:hypothetical protein